MALVRADAMARAYGQTPSAILGFRGALPELVCTMLDLAAHELGAMKLEELRLAGKGGPMGTLDVGSY